MRAWHYLSIANLLLAAVTLAAVVTFRFVPVPVQVTVAAPKPTATVPQAVRQLEYARFSYLLKDDAMNVTQTELEWVDGEGIKISEQMPGLLNQMARSKNRFPKDVSAGLIDLMNLAGELRWTVLHIEDTHTSGERLLEIYFSRER